MKCFYELKGLKFEVDLPEAYSDIVKEQDGNAVCDLGNMKSFESYQKLKRIFNYLDDKINYLFLNNTMPEYADSFETFNKVKQKIGKIEKLYLESKNFTAICDYFNQLNKASIIFVGQLEEKLNLEEKNIR